MTEEQDKQTVSAPAAWSVDARQFLADQLVEQAKTDGISLIGPGGLLSDITKRVLETGLEVSATPFCGHAYSIDKEAIYQPTFSVRFSCCPLSHAARLATFPSAGEMPGFAWDNVRLPRRRAIDND